MNEECFILLENKFILLQQLFIRFKQLNLFQQFNKFIVAQKINKNIIEFEQLLKQRSQYYEHVLGEHSKYNDLLKSAELLLREIKRLKNKNICFSNIFIKD
jgi:hypothetical protein